QNPIRVVNFTVANQVDAISGHSYKSTLG
ncbi:MAG: hypothetical protein RLZZ258_1335, partial [Actinomycetota bacterium]